MSLLYVLNEDDRKVNQGEIGEIMTRVNNALYNLTGLKLCNVALTYEEVLNGTKPVGEILLEEILWKNMTIHEKVLKFSEYLSKVEAIDNDIIIIDSYLFPKKYDNEYSQLIIKIFELMRFKSLKVVTSKISFNNVLFQHIKDNLNMNEEQSIDILFSDDFHDRFWISKKKKGFVVGTSLNGIGNKICLIDMLDESDVNELLKLLNSGLQLAF